LFTPINDYVVASMVEFMTGKKNLDTEWDAYIIGLENLNYKDFVQAKQAAYDTMKK
jgi:putative aldouronate transport system substrate-binding protein